MVSSVDSNRQSEVDSRNKAEASRREAEANKRHAAEIQRLQQQNYERVKELEAAYQKQMSEQREASREAMNARDLKYQQDMEELRKMNREKIMGLTSNYEERLQRTRENSKATIESEKRVNETQKKVLTENLLGEIRRKDKAYQEALEQNRAEQQVGMQRERDKLSEKHQQDLKIITEERNDTVERLSDDLRGMSRAKRAQEREHKNKIFEQQAKASENLAQTVASERRTNNDQQKLQREAFNQSLDTIQKRYADALSENSERNEQGLGTLRDDVKNRQDGQIAVLERRLRETRENSIRNASERKRLFDLEHKHRMESMTNNIQEAERSRELALEDSNRQNAQNIRDIIKKNEHLNHRQHIASIEKMNLQQIKHEDELGQKTSYLMSENDRIRLNSDLRDKQKTEIFERDRKALEEYYMRNLEEIKRNYDQTLSEQRVAAIRERNQALDKLTSQMRANEEKSIQKIALMTSRHDKEVQDIKAKHSKEMDLMRRNYEARIASDAKQSSLNLESAKLKYETQLSNQKEAYEEKIRQMQKAIDQERINMSKAKT